MVFKRKIDYIHGSYRGFLNGFLATSIMGTSEEVNEQLDELENILTRYRPDILKEFFLISKDRIEYFLQNPSNLIEALDFKQDEEKRKSIFQAFRDKINNESFSFKDFYFSNNTLL
jgi:hypothetical protein